MTGREYVVMTILLTLLLATVYALAFDDLREECDVCKRRRMKWNIDYKYLAGGKDWGLYKRTCGECRRRAVL
jgi:hypothetical protein